MSYMQNQRAFSSGIQELSAHEIGFVGGGYVIGENDGSDPFSDQFGVPFLTDKKASGGESSGTNDSGRVGDFLSSVASAVCGFFAKKVGAAAACAVAGEAIKDLADGLKKYPPTDPMDTKLGINTGKSGG